MRDRVFIEALSIPCVVGLYPEERTRTQPLQVDVSFELDSRHAGFAGALDATVDYDRASREIAALVKFRTYAMLETAAEELCAMLLGLHRSVTEVSLTLLKPEALRGRAAASGLSVTRGPQDYPRRRETPSFGEVEVLYESTEAGLYLLHVEAGRAIPPHHHRVMRELEWVASGELHRDGELVTGFDPVDWTRGVVHTYENRSSARATVFCCDSPPFIRDDEIVTEVTR